MFKFKRFNSEIKPKKCTMLPENIGEKVIKVTLNHDEKNGETARALLFVTKGGFVKEHSHAQEQNPDSEIYINLLEIAKNGIEKISAMPEVAGSNSPTGKLKHAIAESQQPQVYLAIKKNQEQNAWQGLSQGLAQYLHTLHFGCSVYGNSLNIVSSVSGKNNEFVVLDLANNKVSYNYNNKDTGLIQENFILPKAKEPELER